MKFEKNGEEVHAEKWEKEPYQAQVKGASAATDTGDLRKPGVSSDAASSGESSRWSHFCDSKGTTRTFITGGRHTS